MELFNSCSYISTLEFTKSHNLIPQVISQQLKYLIYYIGEVS